MKSLKQEFYDLRDLIIEKDFSYLDEEQKKAVLTSDRNVLVTACPGSGKTTALINRVKYLVKYGPVYGSEYIPEGLLREDISFMKQIAEDKNVDENCRERINSLLGRNKINANKIIVITFTKAAAVNMKKRFAAMNVGSSAPFFGTFHALFYKILIRYLNKITLIQSSEEYRIISRVLEKHYEEINEDKVKEIRNNISLLKSSSLSLEEFEKSSEKDIFIECYLAYEGYKAEKELLDFDDLQLKCKELFQSKPKILELYRNNFNYILVDEFQDVDHLQLEILKLLNNKNQLFALGDEDQCIYSFRGSRPDYMVDFQKHFEKAVKLTLSTNYRSTANIVGISNNLIKHNLMRNEKNMKPYKQDKKTIEVLRYQDENSQCSDIALAIEKLRSVGEYDYNNNAVLYRTNMESRSIIDAFIRKKIPFRLLDKEYNFFEHFICKDMLAYLRLSIIPYDYDSFKRIINKPFRYISKVNIEKLKNSSLKMDYFEQLKNIEGVPVFQVKSLDNLQKEVSRLNKLSLQGAIQYIISTLGYHDHISEYCTKYKIPISELEEIIEEFKESASDFNSIVTFLAHVENVSEELKNNINRNLDEGVILSTIHGVKGMEFKNVFIINCVEGIIPHSNNIDKDIEEERRLFFVAITRAIDNLYICLPKNIRAKNKEKSRFIQECGINEFENYHELYKIKDIITHISFGKGTVKAVENNVITIEFFDSIERRFDIAILHNNGIIKKG
jgi:DNA helicase-2/ATP-dependent DNA helicase PcrA